MTVHKPVGAFVVALGLLVFPSFIYCLCQLYKWNFYTHNINIFAGRVIIQIVDPINCIAGPKSDYFVTNPVCKYPNFQKELKYSAAPECSYSNHLQFLFKQWSSPRTVLFKDQSKVYSSITIGYIIWVIAGCVINNRPQASKENTVFTSSFYKFFGHVSCRPW